MQDGVDDFSCRQRQWHCQPIPATHEQEEHHVCTYAAPTVEMVCSRCNERLIRFLSSCCTRQNQSATQNNGATTMKKTARKGTMALITCTILSHLRVFLESTHPLFLLLLLLFRSHSLHVGRSVVQSSSLIKEGDYICFPSRVVTC